MLSSWCLVCPNLSLDIRCWNTQAFQQRQSQSIKRSIGNREPNLSHSVLGLIFRFLCPCTEWCWEAYSVSHVFYLVSSPLVLVFSGYHMDYGQWALSWVYVWLVLVFSCYHMDYIWTMSTVLCLCVIMLLDFCCWLKTLVLVNLVCGCMNKDWVFY